MSTNTRTIVLRPLILTLLFADDPRVDDLLDHGDWEPDDLGYGNPNIFICTEYGCSGCGARNCPTS